ncbi:MAG TPA: AMP-binding protein [Terriglobales bacterium]
MPTPANTTGAANHSMRISDVINRWAEASPDHPALVGVLGTWSYAKLAAVVAQTRAWLEQSGIRPGDRVMIIGENCRAFAAVLLAASSLDAWPVPVNPHLSPREVDAIRDHCGARRIVYISGVSILAKDHAQRHAAVIGEVSDLGSIGLGPLNENTEPEPVEANVGSRVAALIYTSGTTGLPKGVMLTHDNLLFAAGGAAKIRSLTPADRFYGALPLSHIVGLSTIFLSCLLSGATLYLAPRFDPMAARLSLEKDGITILLGVPSMYSLFLQYAKVRKIESLNLPALRIMSCSGAPLAPAIKASVEKLLGLPLHHSYGVTECSPNVAQVRPEDPPRSNASVGRVFPGMEVKLIGDDHQPVPAGEVGELLVRGPNVMRGYYRAPEETAAAIDADGWLNTRDLARFEGDDLFIVGRTKDMIIRFGFNVYPAELETVFNGYPGVAHSAVIGRPIEGDEEIIAFVEPIPGSTVTTVELAEYAAKHLASYKRPSKFIVVSKLPLTPTGKVIKGELSKLLPPKSAPRNASTAEPQPA